MAISVIVADDHPIVFQGIRALLEQDNRFVLGGQARNEREMMRLVERLKPDIIILDLMMTGLNGLKILRTLTQRSPKTRVIAFTMRSDEAFVRQALKEGVSSYVLKQSVPQAILEALRQTAAGRRYLSPPLAERAIEAFIGEVPALPQDLRTALTPREREVLRLVAEGLTSSAIAERLAISRRTVEMHRANLMRKLGLRNQTDLVRYAVRNGLLPPGR